MRRRGEFNPKRHLRPFGDVDRTVLDRLADAVRYGGNPEHKSDPGDFGLTPPAAARQDKTLCDLAGVRERQVALSLLLSGVRKGFISEQARNGFPKNIWAVDNQKTVFEAQLENPTLGVYHGYPMPPADPFRDEVLKEWKARE